MSFHIKHVFTLANGIESRVYSRGGGVNLSVKVKSEYR